MVATILRNKILEGWKRIADERPGLDFSISTPAVNEAWDRLNAAAVEYGEGRNTLADVHRLFRAWEAELIAANQTTAQMFG